MSNPINNKEMLSSMSLRHILLFALMMSVHGLAGEAPASDQTDPRLTLDFNTGWGFHLGDKAGAEKPSYDDTGWAAVSVPHTIRLERKHCGREPYQGVAWYRRHFTADSAWKGRRVNLDFEGIQKESKVFLNGTKLATRAGGYIGFSVDLTDHLRFDGPNVLAVWVSNLDNPDIPPGKPGRGIDFQYYGGLYRNVRLRIQDPLMITDALQADRVGGGGVFVTYPKVSADEARVRVKTHIANRRPGAAEAVVRTILIDPAGAVVAQADSAPATLAAGKDQHLEQELTVAKPRLWHPDHPALYRLVSEVRTAGRTVDRQEIRIGIRRIEFKPEGFFINGERLYLRGGNRHQQLPYIGDALPDSLQRRDAELMRADGFNAVRAAHYPQAPAFLDACDELGLLVIECQPGWQNWTKTQLFHDRTLRDAREMIRRDRNRPCIMLYETFLNETAHPKTWFKEVTDAAHEEYPGDQLFQACDGSKPEYNVGFKVVYARATLEDRDPAKPFLTREWGDWGAGGRKLRSAGELGLINQVVFWQQRLDGKGYDDWGGLDACPRIGGYFFWSWMDHTRGVRDVTASCGAVDSNRYPKFGHYWLRSMTDARNPAWGPMAFIADYNLLADPLKNMVFTDTLHHDRKQSWSVPWTSNSVMAFSNCDSLRLYQDGKLIDEQTRAQAAKAAPAIASKGGSPYFIFTLPERRPGVLRVEGILDGKVAASHEVRTPGKPAGIVIESAFRTTPLVADGSDLYPLYFRIVDEHGTLVPTSSDTVNLSVEGEGRLVGAGIARLEIERQRCEAGLGQAFIRSSGKPGRIVVKASATGLSEARFEITSVASTNRFVPDAPHGAWSGNPRLLEGASQIITAATLPTGKPITDDQIASLKASADAPDRGVALLRDGVTDFGTGWLAGSSHLPQSVTVTLKTPMTLSAVQIEWEKDSTWYTYDLVVSTDGKTWKTLVRNRTVTGHENQPEVFASPVTDVRYVRVILNDVKTGTDEVVIGMSELRLFTP